MARAADIAQLMRSTSVDTVARAHITEHATTALTFNLQRSHKTVYDTVTYYQNFSFQLAYTFLQLLQVISEGKL